MQNPGGKLRLHQTDELLDPALQNDQVVRLFACLGDSTPQNMNEDNHMEFKSEHLGERTTAPLRGS